MKQWITIPLLSGKTIETNDIECLKGTIWLEQIDYVKLYENWNYYVPSVEDVPEA